MLEKKEKIKLFERRRLYESLKTSDAGITQIHYRCASCRRSAFSTCGDLELSKWVAVYVIVRHPMYVAALLLFLSIPLVLGSVISFIIFLGFIPVLIRRIGNEEDVLEQGLNGYKEYKQKVKFRLIPFIW